MAQDTPQGPSANEPGRSEGGSDSTPIIRDGTPAPKDIYDLDPIQPPGQTATRPALTAPSSVRTPAVDKPGLLDGFAEDADFGVDPEVERAKSAGKRPLIGPGPRMRGKAVQAAPGVPGGEGASDGPEGFFVEPGMGSSKVWLIVGGLLLVLAVVAAAITNKEHPVLGSLLVLYNGFLHTGTGVAALGVGAVVTNKRLGPLDLAASRMFAAVSGLLLLTNCTINIVGRTPIEELALGAVVYAAIVAGTFRLWGQTLATVASAHFFFWLIVRVGMEITQHIGRAPAGAVTG